MRKKMDINRRRSTISRTRKRFYTKKRKKKMKERQRFKMNMINKRNKS